MKRSSPPSRPSPPFSRDPKGSASPAVIASLLVALALALCAPLLGRTIVVDSLVCDRMAAIADVAPRQSWAMHEVHAGVFTTTSITLTQGRSFLMRFALGNIPPGQRIAHAELIVPVTGYAGNEPRFYLWRVLADWGPGVCHLYRTARPDKVTWTKPGARGPSSDRATRPTDIVRLTASGEIVINVAEDVALWYSGAAANHGWLFSVEDPGTSVLLQSPVWDGQATWRLRLTYEPQ